MAVQSVFRPKVGDSIHRQIAAATRAEACEDYGRKFADKNITMKSLLDCRFCYFRFYKFSFCNKINFSQLQPLKTQV
jgi:hypothetical protein